VYTRETFKKKADEVSKSLQASMERLNRAVKLFDAAENAREAREAAKSPLQRAVESVLRNPRHITTHF
jgi:hypothetical protein